jgi:hypothetical protein
MYGWIAASSTSMLPKLKSTLPRTVEIIFIARIFSHKKAWSVSAALQQVCTESKLVHIRYRRRYDIIKVGMLTLRRWRTVEA